MTHVTLITKKMTKSKREIFIDQQFELVANALGVRVKRIKLNSSNSFEYQIRVDDLEKPNGFSVYIGDDYQCWYLELVLDAFNKPLIELFENRYLNRKDLFWSYFQLAQARNKSFKVLLNEQAFDASVASTTIWNDFQVEITAPYSSPDDEFEALHHALLDLFCLVLSLLVQNETWEVTGADIQPELLLGREEGALNRALVNRYERSRYNRALCLDEYGFTCRGCGSNLKEIYGPLGKGVIHVHHLVPISSMGASYSLDPLKDLVPLCPNCHNIVHRQEPPISISELRVLTDYHDELIFEARKFTP